MRGGEEPREPVPRPAERSRDHVMLRRLAVCSVVPVGVPLDSGEQLVHLSDVTRIQATLLADRLRSQVQQPKHGDQPGDKGNEDHHSDRHQQRVHIMEYRLHAQDA